MSPYTPNDTFTSVNTYDTDDPVLGGGSGESNEPIEALADRTQYLFNRLGRTAIRIIAGNASITNADVFNWIKVNASGNITLSLGAIATFPVGTIIPFKIKCPSGKAVAITPAAGTIEDGNVTWSTLWACDGEEFEVVAVDTDASGTADQWVMRNAKGNFDIAGNDALCRIQPRNTIVANGCNPESAGALYLRADYPRLWAAVSGSAIADGTWQSNIRYKGFFSTGNGSTTFRVPDMRSQFYRALDLGRGLDLDRLDNVVGGNEADEFKSHNHTNGNYDGLVQMNGFNTGTSFDNSAGEIDNRTKGAMQTAGGSETRPKNIGLIPVIYY